jgi:protein SCO1/2
VLGIVPGGSLRADAQSATSTALVPAKFARTQFASPPKAVADFELVDQDGKPFRLHQLRGQPALVFFGFTNCRSVCPTTLQVLRQAHRDLGGLRAAPAVVLISVDGDRDTPQAMKSYLEPFGKGFIGLTGSPKLVRDIAARFSAVFFKGAPSDNSGNYDVEHTSQVYLVDRSGNITATFYGAPADEIVAVVRQQADSKRAGS